MVVVNSLNARKSNWTMNGQGIGGESLFFVLWRVERQRLHRKKVVATQLCRALPKACCRRTAVSQTEAVVAPAVHLITLVRGCHHTQHDDASEKRTCALSSSWTMWNGCYNTCLPGKICSFASLASNHHSLVNSVISRLRKSFFRTSRHRQRTKYRMRKYGRSKDEATARQNWFRKMIRGTDVRAHMYDQRLSFQRFWFTFFA